MMQTAENPIPGVQRWIEDEIIGQAICPPLVHLARSYRDENGKIDWNRFSTEIVIENHMRYPSGSDQLVRDASKFYLRYITDIAKNPQNTPYTKLFVAPEFPDNDQFDKFQLNVKSKVFDSLAKQPAISSSLLYGLIRAQKQPFSIAMDIAKEGATGTALTVVNSLFDLIGFYGKPAEQGDIEGFPTDRGPVERYRLMSVAPYYLFQVINGIKAGPLTAGRDKSKTYDRNTRLAAETDYNQYALLMKSFKHSDPKP